MLSTWVYWLFVSCIWFVECTVQKKLLIIIVIVPTPFDLWHRWGWFLGRKRRLFIVKRVNLTFNNFDFCSFLIHVSHNKTFNIESVAVSLRNILMLFWLTALHRLHRWQQISNKLPLWSFHIIVWFCVIK